MSLKSRLKKKIRKNVAPIMAKVAPYKTAVISAAASYFLPGAGALTAVGGKYIGQYWGATAARGDGLRGRDARIEGRKVGDRALKYGLVGAGVGTVAAAAVGSWWTPGVFADVWAPSAAPAGVNGLPAGFGGVTPQQSAAASSAFGFTQPATVPAGFGGTTAAQAAAAATAFGYTSPVGAAFPTVTQAAASGSSLWGTVGTAAGAVVQAVPTISGLIKAPSPPAAPGMDPETGKYGYDGGGTGGGGTLNADGSSAAGASSGSGWLVAAAALLLLAG